MRIKALYGGERYFSNVEAKFLKRVKNDGSGLEDFTKTPVLTDEILVYCLSISNQKYMATCGMSTYIIELIDKNTGEKYPKTKRP